MANGSSTNQTNFQVGDVVWLTGGSIRMTIYSIESDRTAVCVWFEGAVEKSEQYSLAMLTKTNPDSFLQRLIRLLQPNNL